MAQQPQDTLISSAVRPRKRKACDVGNVSPVSTVSLRQLGDAATGGPPQLQSPSTQRQQPAGILQPADGRPQIRPAILPGVPTPCQPPCLIPARPRSAAADGATDIAAADSRLASAAETGASDPGPLPSLPTESEPTGVQSPTVAADGLQSPMNARSRSRTTAASTSAAAGAALNPKPSRPSKDSHGHVPPADHHGEAHAGALAVPSALLASALTLRDVTAQASNASAVDAAGTARHPSHSTGAQCAREAAAGGAGPAQRTDSGDGASAAIAEQRDPQQLPDEAAAGAGGEHGGAVTDAPARASSGTLFSPVFSLFGGMAAIEIPGDGSPYGAALDATVLCGGQGRQPEAARMKSGSQGEAVPLPPTDEDVYSENNTQIRMPSAHTSGSQGTADSRGDAESEPLDERCLLAAEEDMEVAEPASPQVEEQYEEDCMEFDPYLFIRNLPPLSSVVPSTRSVLLPRQTRACKQRKTLVLDLDETLVHSSLDGFELPDFSFSVFFHGREHTVAVRQRPHLVTFLEECAQLFEVVVFTASQKVYAEQLLNVLDPERRLIRHRFFRDSCVYVDGNYVKDLSVLGRDLRHTVIIDNSPQAFGFQLSNGIPIESWFDNEADTELLSLLPFLKALAVADDVRPLVTEEYQLHHRVAQAREYDDENRL